MTEPIDDPDYWRGRLEKAKTGELHHAVFRCPIGVWEAIERTHRQILALTIKDNESVLDCGCGWGRLLDLMPPTWKGPYAGVDLSPDFINIAISSRPPNRLFMVGDLRRLPTHWTELFDLAVLVSVRPMVRRNMGDEVWAGMEAEVRRCARRLLYLEYDPDDHGSIE